jgi:hypothetical protein
MAKLSKKQQVRLGDLINEIQVCIHMIDSGKYDTNRWIANKYKTILALYDEFGIEDANLERAQEWQEEQEYQERKRVQERRKARQELRAKAKANRKPSDYTAIALWGEELGSYPYYIEGEQARACAEGAPVNAIYKHEGEWRTLDQMQNLPLKAKLEAQLEELA